MFVGLLPNILVVAGIALVSAFLLYMISQKFAISENPKIDEIEKLLPNANCGGCGKAGCHDFASQCAVADAENFSKLNCPVGGAKVMAQIAKVLGFNVLNQTAKVAVLRCQGS